jgi:hypothetical protein
MPGNDADLGINVAIRGADQAAADAKKVAEGLKNINLSAQQTSDGASGKLGGLGSTLATLAMRLAPAAAGFALLKNAAEEFAEDEAATIKLKEFGVSAENFARAAALVDDIEWISGDKVQAAESLGRILNGNTRELKKYGIEVGENATQEELWAAAQKFSEVGLRKQAALAETLTGQFQIMGKGIGDWSADVIKGANEAFNLTGQLKELNKWFGFVKPIEDRREAEEKARIETEKATVAAKAQKAALEDARGTIHAAGSDVLKLAKNYDALTAAAERANKVTGSKREAAKEGKLATIEKDIADGRISKEEGARKKAILEADDAILGSQADKRTAEDKAANVSGKQRSLNEQATRMREGAEKLPSGEERTKAFEQIDKLFDAAKDLQNDVDDAKAAVEIAAEKIKGAEAKRKGLESTQTGERNEEKKQANIEREKAQQAFADNAKKLREQADAATKKQGAAEEKREKPFRALGDSLRDAADAASSPEEKARMQGLAKKVEDGATDEEIDEATKRGSRLLSRRARSGGKRGDRASEALGRLNRSALDAKSANDEPAAEVTQQSDAAAKSAEKMATDVTNMVNAFLTAMTTVAATAKSAEAKADHALRTGGMGGK